MMFKSPMWITPLPPLQTTLGKGHMAQISMEIIRLPGSVPRGNQHTLLTTSLMTCLRPSRRYSQAVTIGCLRSIAREVTHFLRLRAHLMVANLPDSDGFTLPPGLCPKRRAALTYPRPRRNAVLFHSADIERRRFLPRRIFKLANEVVNAI